MQIKKYIIDSLPNLNKFFISGVGETTMIHIYGPYQSGKSLLIIQLLSEWVSKGFGNALILDTEMTIYNNFSGEWIKRFSKRFGRDVKMVMAKTRKYKLRGGKKQYINDILSAIEIVFKDLDIEFERPRLKKLVEGFLPKTEICPTEDKEIGRSIFVLNVKDISHLFSLMNIEAKIESGGQKLGFHMKYGGDISVSPLADFIKKFKIKFISLDSLGGLLKFMHYDLPDFPARASMLSSLLHSLSRLADEHRLIIFVANHESRSPSNSNFQMFYGGSSVGYGFKYTLYIKKIGRVERLLQGYRAPHIPEKGFELPVVIEEDGFHEVKKPGDKDS